MYYAYIRVSSAGQNVARQLADLSKYDISEDHIFVDYQSGANFDRPNYQLMKRILKKGDTVVIKSIDRLGRNYKMINEEWVYLTKTLEVNINVIDMPILNTNNETDNLMSTFISELVFQILSFVAENERDNIKSRQREGIIIARQKGIHLGRPQCVLPDNFEEVAERFLNKEIRGNKAMEILKMTRSSFYKYLNKYVESKAEKEIKSV